MDMYDQMVEMFGIKPFPHDDPNPKIERRVIRDIDDVGESIKMVESIGVFLKAPAVGCIYCNKCEQVCPEKAIEVQKYGPERYIVIDSQKCLGSSCKRCIAGCPKSAVNHRILKVVRK
jgi:methylamine methyltransferase corrinoid activation protein